MLSTRSSLILHGILISFKSNSWTGSVPVYDCETAAFCHYGIVNDTFNSPLDHTGLEGINVCFCPAWE